MKFLRNPKLKYGLATLLFISLFCIFMPPTSNNFGTPVLSSLFEGNAEIQGSGIIGFRATNSSTYSLLTVQDKSSYFTPDLKSLNYLEIDNQGVTKTEEIMELNETVDEIAFISNSLFLLRISDDNYTSFLSITYDSMTFEIDVLHTLNRTLDDRFLKKYDFSNMKRLFASNSEIDYLVKYELFSNETRCYSYYLLQMDLITKAVEMKMIVSNTTISPAFGELYNGEFDILFSNKQNNYIIKYDQDLQFISNQSIALEGEVFSITNDIHISHGIVYYPTLLNVGGSSEAHLRSHNIETGEDSVVHNFYNRLPIFDMYILGNYQLIVRNLSVESETQIILINTLNQDVSNFTTIVTFNQLEMVSQDDGLELVNYGGSRLEWVSIGYWKDSDSDGLYDRVEQYNGLDPLNRDSDGDFVDDYTEYITGTNPNAIYSNIFVNMIGAIITGIVFFMILARKKSKPVEATSDIPLQTDKKAGLITKIKNYLNVVSIFDLLFFYFATTFLSNLFYPYLLSYQPINLISPLVTFCLVILIREIRLQWDDNWYTGIVDYKLFIWETVQHIIFIFIITLFIISKFSTQLSLEINTILILVGQTAILIGLGVFAIKLQRKVVVQSISSKIKTVIGDITRGDITPHNFSYISSEDNNVQPNDAYLDTVLVKDFDAMRYKQFVYRVLPVVLLFGSFFGVSLYFLIYYSQLLFAVVSLSITPEIIIMLELYLFVFFYIFIKSIFTTLDKSKIKDIFSSLFEFSSKFKGQNMQRKLLLGIRMALVIFMMGAFNFVLGFNMYQFVYIWLKHTTIELASVSGLGVYLAIFKTSVWEIFYLLNLLLLVYMFFPFLVTLLNYEDYPEKFKKKTLAFSTLLIALLLSFSLEHTGIVAFYTLDLSEIFLMDIFNLIDVYPLYIIEVVILALLAVLIYSLLNRYSNKNRKNIIIIGYFVPFLFFALIAMYQHYLLALDEYSIYYFGYLINTFVVILIFGLVWIKQRFGSRIESPASKSRNR